MYNETEKKERRRIITIIIVTVVLILALVVAIVVTATGKSHKNVSEGENSSFVIADEDSKNESTEEKPEEKTEDEKKPEDKTDAKASDLGKITTESDKSSAPEVDTVSDLPDTGAEDLLPIALILGAITTFATSLVMTKHER